MDILYNSKSIVSATEPAICEVVEFASGAADSINIIFSDSLNQWTGWKPKKGDQLEATEGTYKSGAMFIDDISQSRSKFQLKGLSTPLTAKTVNQKSWENVRLKAIFSEIASKYGFGIEFYGVENYLYERVDQYERDFELLHRLSVREGYNIKVNNKKIVVYDERKLTTKPINITPSDVIGDYAYRDKTDEIMAACIVTGNGFKSEAKSSKIGGVLKIDESIYSQAEGDRFAKNYLWHSQKDEETMRLAVELNSGIAGASLITLSGFGIPDGTWIASEVFQKLSNEKTGLILRRWSNV
jgi:hypothetical protein